MSIELNMVANMLMHSAAGANSLPPLDELVQKVPAKHLMICREKFMEKSLETTKTSESKKMKKVIVAIETRFGIEKAILRSPSKELHRLLKKED